MKEYSLRELAKLTSGEVCGDETCILRGVAPLESANSFDICLARTPEYIKKIPQSQAKVFIVSANQDIPGVSFLVHKNPYAAFAKIIALFYPLEEKKEQIHETAVTGKNFQSGAGVYVGANCVIGDDVSLGNNVYIYPGCVIESRVAIGDNTRLYPNVTVYNDCIIGSRVIIHSASVIGSHGFGFACEDGDWIKINHVGKVIIEDDVEIGAGNTIDRGTFEDTIIGRGVKTDNQVHLAHNVELGKNTILVGQSGVAGSTKIGKNCIIAGKAGISGHLTIGDFSIIGPMAGVTSNVSSGSVVSGIPQIPHKLWLKVQSIMPRLPDMRKKLSALEKKVKAIEDKNNG